MNVDDIEAGFEPMTRSRSNTWPMPRPEGYIDQPSIEKAIDTCQEFININILPQQHCTKTTDASTEKKKKAARQNAWGTQSYAELITQAISSSKDQRLTLSQIYDWMVKNVAYFKDKGDSNSSAGWKNSIRHNLSLHNRFMRIPNEGKSSWWMINPDAKFEKSTRRRAASMEAGKSERKRGRARKQVELLKRESLQTDEKSNSSSSSISQEIDAFVLGRVQAMNFESTAFRPRASSCASSYGRLSSIPAALNEPDWTVDYGCNQRIPTQYYDNANEANNAPAVYQMNQVSLINNQPKVNASAEFFEINYSQPMSTDLQEFPGTYLPQQPSQMDNYQIEISNEQVVQSEASLPTFKQDDSVILYASDQYNEFFVPQYTNRYYAVSAQPALNPIQEFVDFDSASTQVSNEIINNTSNTQKLTRNNSLLDDIDEIISREQSKTIDIVNNTMSSTLYISNNMGKFGRFDA